MKPTRVLLTAASTLFVSQVMAGEAVFYITEDGTSMADVAVTVDGTKQLVGKSGFVTFDINSGTHSVELTQYGEWIGDFEFATQANAENAEVQVEVLGGEALEEVLVYTPGQEEAPALGQISGYLESDETGGAVTGARIAITGTEQAVMTDEEGFFAFELPRGEYDVTIAHPNYGKRDVSGVRVMSNVNTGVNLTMSMSGDGVIEEVVAVGSYIPSTATAQERDSSAVLDAIGSEQMARFGDSSAASALKRVVGVTIADGKYVVARGLNERHTSIMLNGASLPSPDPSRRVVPLDIFPSTILAGIEVQKTFTPDVYADSTGSAVKLKTKKFPAEYEGKFSVSVGYNDQVTLKDRNVQQAETLDILGIGASGDRSNPGEDASFGDLASNLNTEETTILPNVSMEYSVGNTLVENSDWTMGYALSVKYSNSWQAQDRETAAYMTNTQTGQADLEEYYDEERTTNDINLGVGLSVGAIVGDSEYTSNTMVLRQTHSESIISRGVGGQQDRATIDTTLDWLERQFIMQQFTGDHYLPELNETDLKWQISFSQASLDNPDRRTSSFDTPEEDGIYYLRWSDVNREYNELADSNLDLSTSITTPLIRSDEYALKASYGLSAFSRTRTAENTELGYKGPDQYNRAYPDDFDIDGQLEELASRGQISIQDKSAASSDYDADWTMSAYYLGLDYDQFEAFRLGLGIRAENSSISIDTFDTGSGAAVSASLDDNDLYLSTNATYFVNEEAQVRLAYYETINRPDLRELAESLYLDPDSGDRVRGNSKLESAEIKNYDVRAEYYFSDAESVSVAYFSKDFEKPIEKVVNTGGAVYTFENGDSGEISGFEIDFRKEYETDNGLVMFWSGNLALIDSEVSIANRTRSMQGQPDSLANFQFGLDDLDSGMNYTLILNRQGESLYSPAQAGSDNIDVLSEPRTELDLTGSYETAEGVVWKLRLKNLLDEKVHLTQAGKTYRSYKKGKELSLGMSYNF